MRLRTLVKPLVIGLAARAFIRHHRARRATHDLGARNARSFASDPRDPVQGFDEVSELQVAPLAVDALSLDDVVAAQDLAGLESEVDQIAINDAAAIELVDVDVAASARDVGDLDDGHTLAAVDRVLLDDDRAAAEGQSWTEALETTAIEYGAGPERELDDIIDEDDVLRAPHASDLRDTPVADHGSGGRRGL
jgi:hypothetical protein